jgi:hypothetical protein
MIVVPDNIKEIVIRLDEENTIKLISFCKAFRMDYEYVKDREDQNVNNSRCD